jgi:hypothetical protein
MGRGKSKELAATFTKALESNDPSLTRLNLSKAQIKMKGTAN